MGAGSRWPAAVFYALPSLVLAAIGVTHPHHLTDETAAYFWQMHVGLAVVFPLLGLALAGLVGQRRDPLAWAVRVLGYVYVVFYGALDALAGIATGFVTDTAVTAGEGPAPAAVPRLYAIGNDLGSIGTWAFFAAVVLVSADAVRRAGLPAVRPACCWSSPPRRSSTVTSTGGEASSPCWQSAPRPAGSGG